MVETQFQSKKNKVFLINVGVGEDRVLAVCKTYRHPAPALERERRLLTEAGRRGLGVPRVLACTARTLTLEFIPGETLCDLVNRELQPQPVVALARWLAAFHRRFPGLVRGDSHLRNFIWQDGVVIGLDFEEATQGEPLADVADLCASILDTDPMFTPRKYELARVFLRAWEERWGFGAGQAVNRAIAMALRRKVPFRPQHREDLLTQARRIEVGRLG